jgi:hypothetical protein
MKRAVFDNWLFMAIASSGALRVRALDTISLLIPGKDLFSAAFSTYPPARRSRPIDASICALKCIISRAESLLLVLHTHIYSLTIYQRTNEQSDAHNAMIHTKLSRAQRRDTQGLSPSDIRTHIGTQSLKFALHSGFSEA